MVGADLQSLVSSHNQSGLSVLLVLQESDITSTTLLPLLSILDELEELSAHLEGLLLEFLVGLNIDFLGQSNNWLEVNVLGFWGLILRYDQFCSCKCMLSNNTSGFSSAAAAFCALADPELSPRSSSSFFSFLAPPPNIEKTLSVIPVAAEVTVAAAVDAAAVACSVKVLTRL